MRSPVGSRESSRVFAWALEVVLEIGELFVSLLFFIDFES
jgi:hypothetical protein